MKRTVLFIVFFALTITGIKSQNITKGQLTNVVFYALYGDTANPNNYPASDYPNIYFDLQEGSVFEKIAKHLGYLEFGDGISALWRDNPTFNTAQIPYHVSIIKVLLEAWDVPIISSGVSLPYSDVNPSTIYYDYVLTAYDLGMLPNSSQLYPMSGISLMVVSNYITFLENNVPTPSQSDLMDEDNYFLPNNLTPDNLGFARGMEQGVFSHYAKNSFVIPDIKFNLGFSHFYSTQMVETPEGFYPIKPLGRGWSHTYNSYITFNQNVGFNGEDFFYIVWPDGTIHVYDEDEEEYLTKGVYDEFDEDTSTRIYITKKNQVRYKYEKLDSDKDIYYLTEIRDPNGNEINIDYENAEENDTRRIEEVEAPSGKTLEFQYENGTDLIYQIEDPIGRIIEFDYSDLLQNYYPTLVKFDDAKNNHTVYQYYADNVYEQYLLRRIDLPRGNQIKAQYDDNGKLEEYQIDDDDPVEIEVNFDYGDGEFTSTVQTPIPSGTFTQDYTFNQNGMVTEYSSDTDNVVVDYPSSGVNVLRPTDTNLNGVSIEYEYDSDGNVTEIDKGNGDSVETFDYDGHNNLTEYTDANGNITNFYYDNDENLVEIVDALGNSIYYTYDSYGQLISVTNQEGITVDYTYESDGALSSVSAPEGLTSSFSYDGVNRLLQRNDNGLVSSYDYDDNDNLTYFSNSGGYTTTYDYDANDNLTEITNANLIDTSFVYDDQDRVIEEHFDNLVKEYEYGDEGYLEEYTKPSGMDIDYEYDDDGRLEETGTITDISYNNENLVEDISNVNGTVYFDYDDLNRVEEVTTIHGYTVLYDYLDSGHLEEITYPTINGIEIEVDYGYDDKNRLVDVVIYTNNTNDATFIAELDYLDDDRLESIEYGNGIARYDFYDNAGRLNDIFIVNDGTNEVVYENIMTLDTRGNIVQEWEIFQPIPPGYNPGSSSNNPIIGYSYDDNNHILGAGGVNYNVDDDGNTVSIDGGQTFIYDVDDRLVQYTDVDNNLSFKYNPYGQRIEADRNGTVTKYVRDVLQDNILIELDGNNDPINYYIYTPSGMLLARMKPTGELYYYHGDTRGSVVAITDESAAITHQYRYEDFGRLTKKYEPVDDANLFRYVGAYGVEYELTDLYYMRARYYKPGVGRFLTEDPIWSTNLYPYADNNPIKKIDPLGEESFLSNEWLSNKFYENGYGDAANLLSQESEAWDFALNNPEVSGAIIGLGAGATIVGIAYGGVGIANLISNGSNFTYQFVIAQGLKSGGLAYAGVTSPIKGQKLFYSLGKIEDGNNSYITPAIINAVGLFFPLYKFNKKLLHNYSNYAK